VNGIPGSSESNNPNFNQIPRENNQFGNEKIEIQEGQNEMFSNRQKHEVQQPKQHQNCLPLEPKHPAGARIEQSRSPAGAEPT
jgi:phosphosulfolactate synthase (CoM biosynthesis protein A)